MENKYINEYHIEELKDARTEKIRSLEEINKNELVYFKSQRRRFYIILIVSLFSIFYFESKTTVIIIFIILLILGLEDNINQKLFFRNLKNTAINNELYSNIYELIKMQNNTQRDILYEKYNRFKDSYYQRNYDDILNSIKGYLEKNNNKRTLIIVVESEISKSIEKDISFENWQKFQNDEYTFKNKLEIYQEVIEIINLEENIK